MSGTVRIGAPDGFGVAYLAPRLGRLTAEHRELSIQLVPVPRSFSLSRREADIAITVERPTEGRLVAAKARRLFARALCLARLCRGARPAANARRALRPQPGRLCAAISSSAPRSTTPPSSAPTGLPASRSPRRSARSRRCAPAPASASCTPSSRALAAGTGAGRGSRPDPPRLLAGLSRERAAAAPRPGGGRASSPALVEKEQRAVRLTPAAPSHPPCFRLHIV